MKERIKKHFLSFTASYIIVITVFLLIINMILGFVVLKQSSSVLMSMIQSRMLDISNTAAGMLDGNLLEKFNAENTDSPEYQNVLNTLKTFQKNIKLQYIYCVRDMGNKNFVFILDPDPENPADFGEPIIYTDTLYEASLGKSTVDDKPVEDEWGNCYSAYSPVFNSEGKVTGIVGVDFGAEWYNDQLINLFRSVVIASIFSFLIGALIVFVLNAKLRKRFGILYERLNELSGNVEELISEIDNFSNYSVFKAKPQFSNITSELQNLKEKDDIDVLGDKILSMQLYLKEQIAIAHSQAYIDALTSVGNKNAYMDLTKHLDKMIKEGIAIFSVAVFDINSLKMINDKYGHECGDLALIDASRVLTSVFGKENLYRIGGDEFAAIVKQLSDTDMDLFFQKIDKTLSEENKTVKKYQIPLAIAKGYAIYTQKNDNEYKNVFRRADKKMYADKIAYYRSHGYGQRAIISESHDC